MKSDYQCLFLPKGEVVKGINYEVRLGYPGTGLYFIALLLILKALNKDELGIDLRMKMRQIGTTEMTDVVSSKN